MKEKYCARCGQLQTADGFCGSCGFSGGRSLFVFARRAAWAIAVSGCLILFIAARNAQVPLVAVSDITPAMKGGRIRVSGEVVKISPPRSMRAPHHVLLNDRGAYLPLVFWPDELPRVAECFTKGRCYEIAGTVGLYKGRLQLYLENAHDVRECSW